MAQVPYSPVPSVAPSTQGESGVNVRATEDAFGAAVGKANTHFGAQLERSSDEIFTRAVAIQTQLNDAAAKEADAQYVVKSADIFNEYGQLRGKDAIDRRQEYVDKLNSLREEVRGGLSNPAAQRMYDASTRQQFARTVFAFSSHAKDQGRQYADQADETTRRVAVFDTVNNPKDFAGSQANLAKGLASVEAEGIRKGQSKGTRELNQREYQSKFIATQTETLSQEYPQVAFDMFQANKALLSPEDKKRVEKVVVDGQRRFFAREAADTAMFGIDPDKPDRTLAELQEEAVNAAGNKIKADPELKGAIEDRVTTEWGKLRRNKIETQRTVNNVLSGYINGNTTGHPVTSVDELTAYPEGFAAWNKLNQTEKTKWGKAFAANAKGQVAEHTTDERWRLEAMAENDVEEFLNQPIGANLNLSPADKNKLMELQKKKQKEPDKSPAIRDAMTQLRPMLQAIQLTPDRKDDYYRFQGALQDQIRDYQLEHKNKPPPEEIQKMGSRLIQEKADQSWLGKQFYGADRLYKREVPNDRIKQQIVDKFWEKNGQAPEDWQIRQEYTRALYRQTFNPKGPKKDQSKAGQPKPPESE